MTMTAPREPWESAPGPRPTPSEPIVDPLTGTVPGGKPDAEVAVLAGALLDADACAALLERGDEGWFTHPHRAAVFRAIRHAREDTPLNGVDVIAVRENLRSLDVAGAASTLARILEHPPIGTHWSVSLDICDRATHERQIEKLRNILARTDPGPQQDMVIDRLQQLREVAPGSAAEQVDTLADFIAEDPEPPVDELISGVLARGGVNLLFGPSGSGKSWAALDLALAATAGAGHFCGIEEAEIRPREDGSTERVLWLYGAEDNRRRVKTRMLALTPHHSMARPEHIAARPCFDLDSPAGIARVRALILQLKSTLVFVDTVSSATTLNLSKEEVVKPFLTALLRVADSTGVTFVLVHHTRKAGKDVAFNPYALDNMLGSGQWRNLASGIILVHGEDGDIGVQGKGIDVVVGKSKDLDHFLPRTRVHWDKEEHRFVMGETPREAKQNDQDAQHGAILLVLLRKGPRNVSSRMVQGYGVPSNRSTKNRRLAELVERGLVDDNGEKGSAKAYSLTPKGERMAKELEQVEQQMDENPDAAFDAVLGMF